MSFLTGKIQKSVILLSLAAAVAGLSGCAGQNYPAITEAERYQQRDYDYRIGPGDQLDIFVWGNEELTVSVPVRPDGKITTRLVEDLDASGKTATELAREVEKVYATYIKNPIVSVIVNNFTSIPEQQIRVVGDGVKPLKVPYSKHMTLLDLMIEVGELDEFANGNKAVLVRRDANGVQHSYQLKLDDLLKDGDISANLTMQPGDIVIIPQAWF